METKNELIVRFLPLAFALANKYKRGRYGYLYPDIISESTIGLIYAINKIYPKVIPRYYDKVIRSKIRDYLAKATRRVNLIKEVLILPDLSAEFLEQINSVANKRERKYIELKLAGLEDKEIKLEAKISLAYISTIRVRLFDKLCKLKIIGKDGRYLR